MLENPELLDSVYKESQNSDGSSQEELEKYLDSIEGKIQQFTNEVQEFWYNLISSDTIKLFIDFGTKVVDIIGNVIDKFGELGTLGTVAAGIFGGNKLYKNFFTKGQTKTWVDEIVDDIVGIFSKENLNKNLDKISNIPSLKNVLSGEVTNKKVPTMVPVKVNKNDIVDDWTSSYLDDLDDLADANNIVAEASVVSSVAVNTDTVNKTANKVATDAATASNGLFAKSLTALKAAAPYLLAITAAIAAIAITVKLVDDAIETAAEANEKFENSKSAYENTKSELESLNSELDKTKEKIEELESLGKLTVTEKDELKTLKSQRKELERQIDLKEKLAKKQQEKTAENAYNAINHAQIEQKETATGIQPVRYDGKVSKISADIEKYQDALNKQSRLEIKLAGKDSIAYDDIKWYQKLIYDDPYKKVSDELDTAKKDSSELFDSINADMTELQEQRAALFDEDGNLIDESYRTTADAIERLIIQFSNAGDEAANNELKLFDTFHPEQIADKIKKFDDSIEITQDNLGATEEDFLKLEKQGVLSVEYITEKFPNIATAARAAGLSLQDLVDHFVSLNREAAEAGKSGEKGLYSIKNIVDDTNSAFNKAKTAQETENMGATYDTMREQYKTAKELLEKGDVGTDDFKQIAAMFSPTGATDSKNFKENAGKIKRYFTEDNTGVLNFLNDLKKHNLAKYNKETKEWSYSIGNLEEAAKKLGIGFEPMMAIFGELNDKGFYNDFFSTTEDGTAHLLDLQEQLQTAEEELQNLYDTDPKNSTAIQAKIDEIDTLKERITKTTDALAELINEDPEEKLEKRKKKKKQLKTAIESYNANYEKLSGTKDGQAVLDEWKAEIEQYVAENGFTIETDVTGKLKIVNVKEASEEAEEESKENPVKVSGVTNKYRVNQSNQYSNDDKTKTALLNRVKAENFGMAPEEMKKYADEYLRTGEDSKGLILKTFSGKNTAGMASAYRSVNKKILDAYKTGDNLNYNQQMNMIGQYSFEDLSSINFDDDEVSYMESEFITLADTFGITKDEYRWFIEYLKDNDYIQIDTADAVENVEELQNYLSEGDYEKVVELVGKDNASGVVNLWNALSANDKFAELSAEDKATMLIETWNEATPEEKEVILKGGEQAEQTIASILGKASEDTATIELDSGQVVAATEEALGLKTALEETTKPNYEVAISSNPLENLLKYAKNLITYLQNLTEKPYNVIVNTTYKTTGTKPSISSNNSNPTVGDVEANGTVNGFANGTIPAHANGTKVTIQKDETALMNEIGNEGIVRGGKLYEVNGGAQKVHLKRGDIVFNHKQMAELKKNGYVTSNGGRGRIIGAYANGTATSMMNAYSGEGKKSKKNSGGGSTEDLKGKNTTKKSTTKSSNNNNNNNTDKDKDSSKTLIDWIERRLDVLKTKADRWATVIENATDPNKITKYYNKLESNYKSQVKTAYDAIDRYRSKANSVDLENKYKKLVYSKSDSLFTKDGNLKSYKTLLKKYGEKTATAIQDYEEWYDKYQSAVDTYIEACTNLYNAPIEEAAAKIEKFSDAINILDAKIDNAIGSKNKNKLLDQKLDEQNEIWKASYTAKKDADYNFIKEKRKFDSAKDLKKYSDLNEKEKKSILNAVKQNKEIDLTYFDPNSKGYKDAISYNASLKGRIDANNNNQEITEETIALRREITKQKFDNVADDYDKKVSLLEHGISYLDNKIAEIEASGQNAHIGYYEQQAKIEKQKKDSYTKEASALEKQLKLIPKGTDEWYEAYNTLQDVNGKISEATQNIYKYNDAINEAQFNLFEKTTEQLGRIQEENEFLRKMMNHEKNFDDTGRFTEAGLANLQTLTEDYYVSKSKSSTANNELEKLLKMRSAGVLEGNGYKFNSMDSLNQAIDDYYDKVRSYKEEEYESQEAIFDLMKESYESQLNAMKELIDEKKEALSVEKDLYDYSNQISDKTKNIATLEKQLALYRNDTSEEGRAKAQKLQSELNDAQKDLRDTEYDRYISDQQDMLDDLYDEYEEFISDKLDNFMEIVQEGIAKSESSIGTSNKYLENLKNDLGYTEEFKKSQIEQNGIKNAIGTECSKIVSAVKLASGTTGKAPSDINTDKIINPDGKTSNTSGYGYKDLGTDTQKTKASIDKKYKNKSLLEIAQNYINKYASKPKKNNKKDYKYVNQKIWDYTKGKNKKGKVLSDKELKTLASKLGVKYNNSSKNGNLAKKLNEIGFFKGFSSGGKVVEVDDINKMVRANGDDGIASVRKGEAILTPIQSKQFELFTSRLKEMNGLMDYSSAVMDMQDEWQNAMREVGNLSKSSMFEHSSVVGDVHLHATFPNVTDASKAEDMIRAIQDNQKLQKTLQSVTIDQLNGAGRLSSRRIK